MDLQTGEFAHYVGYVIDETGESTIINMKELQAINKKCKELRLDLKQLNKEIKELKEK